MMIAVININKVMRCMTMYSFGMDNIDPYIINLYTYLSNRFTTKTIHIDGAVAFTYKHKLCAFVSKDTLYVEFTEYHKVLIDEYGIMQYKADLLLLYFIKMMCNIKCKRVGFIEDKDYIKYV
jgi:hypothetical protein